MAAVREVCASGRNRAFRYHRSMGSALSFFWPRTLGYRGGITIVLTALSVAVPAYVGWRLYDTELRASHAREADALLALALVGTSESDPNDTGEAGMVITWLNRECGAIRWAGAFDSEGNGVELRRRTTLPLKAILDQIDFKATAPGRAPLRIDGSPAQRFSLITVPREREKSVLAFVFEEPDPENTGLAARLGALLAASITGIFLAFLMHRALVQGPIQKLGRILEGFDKLNDTQPLAANLPTELGELARTVEQVAGELKQWRGEATQLRYTLDSRVDARTKEVERALRQAEREADTDALTKLFNRRYMLEQMPDLFARAADGNGELSAMLMDVDRFKQLNDTLGHQAGDELLVFLGELIRATIRRGTDVAVRSGGDEFVILMPNTDANQAKSVGKRIAALFAQRTRAIRGVTPPPALSIGVASVREHQTDTPEDLLRRADAAMYFAKRRDQTAATWDEAAAAGVAPGAVRSAV